MKARILNGTKKNHARTIGLLYLLIAIVGGFSMGYMPSVVIVDGDATATFQALSDNMGLFKMGVAADVGVVLLELFTTVLLYQLFKPVNSTLSTIAAFSRLAMAIIIGLNIVNYMMPIVIITKPSYLGAFAQNELEGLLMLFLKAHKYGEFAWQIFFGVHLTVLGYMVVKSGYAPKLIGIAMMLGGVGYFSESISNLMMVDSPEVSIMNVILLTLAVVGELSFTFYLLIKGVKQRATM